jgi:hypothetical protein
MDRKKIIGRLLEMPSEIFNAETEIFDAQCELLRAKDILTAKEAELYAEGKIDGKNAEIRSAQLKQLTTAERNIIATAENNINLARITFNHLYNEFKMLQTVAYLIEGAE